MTNVKAAANYPKIVERIRVGTVGGTAVPDELEPTELLTEFDSLAVQGELTKHVYAAYGLAAYYAQCLETGLVNLAMAEARVSGKIYFRREADQFEQSFTRKTLGAMLSSLRHSIEFDGNAAELLMKALNARNQLIHGFFYRNATAFMNSTGKRKMVESCCGMIALFRAADLITEAAIGAVHKVLGVPASVLREEFERMKSEAEAG